MSFGFAVEYNRGAGIHKYETHDGVGVTAVAVPTWKAFVASMDALPQTSGYIITPELITLHSTFNGIRDGQLEANARINLGRQMSLNHLGALMLLGSTTIDASGALRNSLAVIRNGSLEGYVDKRGSMWVDEESLFSRRPRPQAGLLRLGHSALICSDIISASFELPDQPMTSDLLNWNTETIFLSSCWAVPRMVGKHTPVSHEERFRDPLERTIARLFNSRPNLKEVIVVDRSIPDSQVRPYNAHFKRVSSKV